MIISKNKIERIDEYKLFVKREVKLNHSNLSEKDQQKMINILMKTFKDGYRFANGKLEVEF